MSHANSESHHKPRPPIPLKGAAWLQNPLLNKGTAFTEDEREALGLRGLLPPRVTALADQVARVMTNYRKKPNDLERYIHLIGLQDRSETLFYRVLVDHLEEMMPIIYTPTVGRACQEYGNLYRRARGFYISANDRGEVEHVLQNWPADDVRVIVVTDGERILGLGDLGAHGMGIPVGKLSLYCACGGIDPRMTMPVVIDVGTENETLLRDPLYTGLRQKRVRGPAYDDLVDEFVHAVQKRFPRALIQFEDFGNLNAFRLLHKYQDQVCTFNDDIQGTGAVALAGVLSALRLTRRPLKEQTLLFLGAGEAAVGIADVTVAALREEGLSVDEARRRCWLIDSKGLVVRGRANIKEHALPYAHEHAGAANLAAAVEALKPTALLGASGTPGMFTKEIVERMAALNERPIIFALSNPTSKSECTAEQAYSWSEGRAIFASGSPFEPVILNGRKFVPGQGNNAYVFPGVGLGAVVCESRRVTDSMFLRAARELAALVRDEDLALGRIYPALSRIREVSAAIATVVADEAWRLNLAQRHRPEDVLAYVKSHMYEPAYTKYV